MKKETVEGQRSIDHHIFVDRLMNIQARAFAMRCNDLRILSAAAANESLNLSQKVVKLQGTALRHDLEGLAIDVMREFGLLYGNTPYLRDNGSWQRNYMFYLGLIIGGGTAQIQKNIIAERGLGLPREPQLSQG